MSWAFWLGVLVRMLFTAAVLYRAFCHTHWSVVTLLLVLLIRVEAIDFLVARKRESW